MNLARMLSERVEAGKPVRVGVIGGGKFTTMFLSQAPRVPGIHVVAVADLDVDATRRRCRDAGWDPQRAGARNVRDALDTGTTFLTDDTSTVLDHATIEVVVEATGDPACGLRHAAEAIEQGIHVIMVTVEADVVAGPLLARRAQSAGVVYSLAWGDQPSLICEHVDWARTCGFEVVCAGKGTRYHPDFHRSTPDTVWTHYGIDPATAAQSGMNPTMFNSFTDGTKSAIEMAAVCNATGLKPQRHGLAFPPASRNDLADVCRPEANGGVLTRSGTVEVVSSLHRDMSAVPHDLRFGTFVVISTENDYVRRCFSEYGVRSDDRDGYAALFRPVHLVGLELGISVAAVALRAEATGVPGDFQADVATVAKQDLTAGTVLDGEGGFFVRGALVPAARSLTDGILPIGLARHVRLLRDVKADDEIRWKDVAFDENDPAAKMRREMASMFGGMQGT